MSYTEIIFIVFTGLVVIELLAICFGIYRYDIYIGVRRKDYVKGGVPRSYGSSSSPSRRMIKERRLFDMDYSVYSLSCRRRSLDRRKVS